MCALPALRPMGEGFYLCYPAACGRGYVMQSIGYVWAMGLCSMYEINRVCAIKSPTRIRVGLNRHGIGVRPFAYGVSLVSLIVRPPMHWISKG